MSEYSTITVRMMKEENEEWDHLRALTDRFKIQYASNSNLNNTKIIEIKHLINRQIKKWFLVKKTVNRLIKADNLRMKLCKINFN